MNIVHLSITPMASVPWNFTRLINKYTNHKAYLLQDKELFMCIGHDLMPKPTEVEEIINNADVLHFHGTDLYDLKMFRGVDLCAKMRELESKGKVFLEFHGTPQRGNRSYFRPNAKLIVSTPEMLHTFPEAIYFPNLIDEQDINYRFIEKPKPPPLKVCHHWSYHKHVKDTDTFKVMQGYTRNGVETVLLPQLKLIDCLRERQKFHAVFDHMQGYYGMISIEGLAQGLVVINGIDDWSIMHLCKALNTKEKPPFVRVNKENIYSVINNLFIDVCKNNSYEKYANYGRKYIEEFWSGEKQIKKLIEIYETL